MHFQLKLKSIETYLKETKTLKTGNKFKIIFTYNSQEHNKSRGDIGVM